MDVLQSQTSCAILPSLITAWQENSEGYIFYSREPCRRGLRGLSRSLAGVTLRPHHKVLCIVDSSKVMEVIDQ